MPPLPVNDSKLACEVELDFGGLDVVFLFVLMGRICNLGLTSVPEFSAVN